MAKQKGFIKLEGSLGGLTFYKRDGESFVKTTGGVDKNRIESDPAFKRTRENMSEFGASATIGKALRIGFASLIKIMGGSNTVGRIVKIMKRVNSVGPGARGERSFEFLPNKVLLEGFEFNLSASLDAIFYPPYVSPTLDANRSIATWTVVDFSTDNFINPPEGATHFRLALNTTVLSDYTYNSSLKAFEPVNEAENETSGIAVSAEIPLGGMVGADTTLTVDLGFAATLPATVAVISAIGIIFYQEINAQFYELASDNSMRIDAVG
ncbi:MAG: hypothetical protein COA67_03980 [Lutibacter sp.]|nr:MAG: hypothetical protein COA67_03980 [Lutibacter sp.]